MILGASGYRLCDTGVALLRKKSDLDRRSQTHTVSRLDENMLHRATAARWDMPRPARWPTSSFVNMVAGSGIGSTPPQEAAERAQKRAER